MSENVAKYRYVAHSVKTGMLPKELRTFAQKAWENRGKLLKPTTQLNFYINAACLLDTDVALCAELATDANNSTMRSRTLPPYEDLAKMLTAVCMAKHLCVWKSVMRGEQSLVNTETVTLIKDMVRGEVVRIMAQLYNDFLAGNAIRLPEILRYRYQGVLTHRYRTIYAMEAIYNYIRPEAGDAKLNLTLEHFTRYCELQIKYLYEKDSTKKVTDELLRQYGQDMFTN